MATVYDAGQDPGFDGDGVRAESPAEAPMEGSKGDGRRLTRRSAAAEGFMLRFHTAVCAAIVAIVPGSDDRSDVIDRAEPQAVERKSAEAGMPSAVEFPPQDQQLLSLLRTGAAAKLAQRQLREAPDSPETIRLLAAQGKIDDMLRALPLLVETHPERIAQAFELLSANMSRVQMDDTRGVQGAPLGHRGRGQKAPAGSSSGGWPPTPSASC